MKLSVALITLNEQEKLGATLESAKWADEIIVVDSGSTDLTLDIARAFHARVYTEPWKGYAVQKNSAIEKATGDWILSLDADEAVEPALAEEIRRVVGSGGDPAINAYYIPRKNYLFGRWMKHGGWWPDPKLRLFRRGAARFAERAVHESMETTGRTGRLQHALVHNAYARLSDYIAANNKYSSLGAQVAYERGRRGFSFLNIVVNPIATFVYNYFLRLGFLDGKEGLLLHLYHSAYVSWKYAKVWEMSRKNQARSVKS